MTTSITFSETFISFLSENYQKSRVCRVLYNYKYYPNIKSYKLMIVDDDVNYITFRNNGTISFLPKGKTHVVNDSGTWSKENRQEGKPAKVMRKLFTAKALKLFKESDFEIFNAVYKTHFNTELKLELLPNNQIGRVYDMERKSGGGTLNSSCMNGDSSYMQIYEKCDALQILVLKDGDGLLCGRALIWKIGDKIIMDRIYYADDYMQEIFIDYATKNGMTRKSFQTYSDKSSWIDSNGKCFNEYYTIHMDTDFSQYPYIDTFTFGDDGFLTNEDKFIYTYDNTNGNRGGDEDEDENHDGEIWDEIDDEYIDDDDAIHIDYGRYAGCYTHYCNTVTTIDGGVYWNQSDDIVRLGNGDVTHIDNITYCEYDNDYYLSEDCILIENGKYSDQYFHNNYVIIDINGNTWYMDDDEIVKIDYLYYPIDSELITQIDGTYMLIANLELEIAD